MTKILLLLATCFFIHCNIGTKAYSKEDTLCVVPPAIYDRLASFNLIAITSTNGKFGGGTHNVEIYIDDARHLCIYTNLPNTNFPPRFLYGFLLLKDI